MEREIGQREAVIVASLLGAYSHLLPLAEPTPSISFAKISGACPDPIFESALLHLPICILAELPKSLRFESETALGLPTCVSPIFF